MPFTRPVTTQLVAVTVEQVDPPGTEVTTYPPIAAPPSVEGADQDTSDEPLSPLVAATPVGAAGTVDGTTGADTAEAAPVPAGLVAVTVNVYATPFVRPSTVHDVHRVARQENPPGLETTVYDVIATPPLLTGAVHDTTEDPSTAVVPATEVGAPGTVRGTAPAEGRDAAAAPEAFDATTVNE